MSVDQSVEYTHQLPLDIRILIALSNSQTASLMYIYDTEFRKYTTEPAFVRPFIQFVSIESFGNRVIKKLNNREIHIGTGLFAYQSWYLDGKLHRVGDPAIDTPHVKEYYLNGKLHRDDGPALTNLNEKKYYINGKLHREDGPAAIYTNGTVIYYINDKRHREDGPAAIYSNGQKFWYLNGNIQSVDDFV